MIDRLAEQIADAVLEKGRRSASGEVLVIDRLNLVNVILAVLREANNAKPNGTA